MRFTLKHREQGFPECFATQGVCFKYDYDALEASVSIHLPEQKEHVYRVHLDKKIVLDPLAFIHAFEKTSQVEALHISNKYTSKITDIFEDSRLFSFLQNTAQTATYGVYLQNNHYTHFSRNFCKDYSLDALEIKSKKNILHNSCFFEATLKTRQRHTVITHSKSLHKVIRKLSYKTSGELFTKEVLHSFRPDNAAVNKLIMASNRLKLISKILDDGYAPNLHIQYSKRFKKAANT